MSNEETTTESKSLHTKGIWSRRDLEIIGPYGSDKSICEMTGNFMHQSESIANAKRIITCVNSHDELVKALEGAKKLLLEMGRHIRNTDEDNEASEYWNLDGDYIPQPEFEAIKNALKKASI